MSSINIKPTKRYDNIKEMLEDTAKMYGSQDAFRYKSGKEIVSKTYNDIRNDSMTFSNVLKSKVEGDLGKALEIQKLIKK